MLNVRLISLVVLVAAVGWSTCFTDCVRAGGKCRTYCRPSSYRRGTQACQYRIEQCCLPKGSGDQRLSCPRVSAPRNGRVHGSSTTPGASIRFTCNRGYSLRGSDSATCQTDGRWSSPRPTCERIATTPSGRNMESRYGRTIMNVLHTFSDTWTSKNPRDGYRPAYGARSQSMQWLEGMAQTYGRGYSQGRSRGGTYRGPSTYRREYRQLSRTERESFHAALQKMMSTTVPGTSPPTSQYHFLVQMHQADQSPAAHRGPAFTPWHRIYLIIFEQVLKSHDSGVTLPYWDSTLDRNLPNARQSILFSDKFLGTTTGQVTTGPFANWKLTNACRNQAATIGGTLTRGDFDIQQALYQDDDIDFFNEVTSYTDFITNRGFEASHGGPHVYIGGHMGNILCSPSDPIFWMHHAFVDRMWEDFRQNTQTTPLATDYPPTSSTSDHEPSDPMRPFTPLTNIDGLHPFWTTYFRYNSRPVTCTSDRDCGDYLWCHNGRCKSKVRVGGDCTGLPAGSTSPCECGGCYNNECAIRNYAQQLNCDQS